MHTLVKRLFIMAIITIYFAHADNMSSIKEKSKLNSAQEKLAKLESSFGGRIGVYAINTANNQQIQYRSNERFPFCSTSKVMVVAAILSKSETDSTLLQKQIKYSKKYVEQSGYAPITRQHITDGMDIANLCQAAIEYSDNTAMNLLINNLGGVSAVNSYAKSINDNVFRLDRIEPSLNTAIPGDMRDTTTPFAMGNSLQHIIFGDLLKLPQREKLIVWLKNNTTGDAKIRAGVPKGWVVADKTGSGSYGTANDIAVIWPPKRSPIIVAIYTIQNKKHLASRDDVIASATHILLNEFSLTDKP